MKTLNVTFTDQEFEQLESCKKNNGDKSWHDFLLLITEEKELD